MTRTIQKKPVRRRPPILLLIPALAVSLAMLVPVLYLFVRTGQADTALLARIIFRQRNLVLLRNTIALTFGVSLTTIIIALPLAWLTMMSDLQGKRIITILSVLPLAIPGYVMAYALSGLGGNFGIAARLFGIVIPRPYGFWGALTALSLYTFPYMFLNLRASFAGLDPGIEESARSLGNSPVEVFFRVVLPLLKPGFLGGILVVALYVMGDFGVVALMRYEVFSYAIYTQYAGAFDRVYAAALAVMLLCLTAIPVIMEARFLNRNRYERTGTGVSRKRKYIRLGWYALPAYSFTALVVFSSVLLPVGILIYWMILSSPVPELPGVARAFTASFSAAFPAAAAAVTVSLPLVYLRIRYPSRISKITERIAYMGYAVPPLALALAFVFFSIRVMPVLYQTLPLLVTAYMLNFLALAMGPVRSALLQAPAHLEEAARSLGRKPVPAFFRTIFPLLRKGITGSLMLVFVMAMKELPIAFLLAPTGFTTLSVAVFSRTSEAMMSQAAPYAAAIVLFSSAFVGLMLEYEGPSREEKS